MGGRAAEFYSLAPRGAKKPPSLPRDREDLAGLICETFADLDKKPLAKIAGQIRADYPLYAGGPTKDRAAGGSAQGGERFGLETERMMQELESADAGWRATP